MKQKCIPFVSLETFFPRPLSFCADLNLFFCRFNTIAIVQWLSCVQCFAAQWTIACQAPLSSIISQSLLKFMPLELVMLSNHLILCHPLCLLPLVFPSIRVFSKDLALCIELPKYWIFSNSPSNDQSRLISFRIKKAREFQKSIYFCFIDCAKTFDCVDHNRLWKILKEMGIPDHLTCLLRNLYAGQEATVRTAHGTTDWFQIRKGVRQGCILSPCLFNLYAEYIMQNVGLDEAQAGIKVAGRNINNLRYAHDTTLMAESEKELKSLLMKVKEESEKVGLSSTFRKQRSWHLVPSLHVK